ncbi:hypothetical protein LKR43_07705 [Pusillimonas sp. MFBS29]|uniref:hypothetical protein n=1 Tax=Pusillimonas sp. MFBS29 TaxID=2886690 RepID=UPI001D1262D4|nr:hypothetical protein [Pusillimonas sp. MFBS29]MCC2596222.1 hypothetical protein [Pusillimonas sp. MFBS29]
MTEQTTRRAHRSPNYPQYPIQWALENSLALLDKERLHPVPLEIIAQGLGYKGANNGAARRALAILRAFGMLQKAPGGKLQVSPDVQRYKLTPNDSDKAACLQQWLKTPLLYSKLLNKYQDSLPSDQALIFELVAEHGFNEPAAQQAIEVFRSSLDYVSEMTGATFTEGNNTQQEDLEEQDQQTDIPVQVDPSRSQPESSTIEQSRSSATHAQPISSDGVRYPIRLAGGRMAWIEVPDPFYEADKKKLQAQLGIIGTVDEDNEFEELNM